MEVPRVQDGNRGLEPLAVRGAQPVRAGRGHRVAGGRGHEVGRALQAALVGGLVKGGAWSGVHMEVSRPAQQHGVQGGGARVRRASDPGHESFTLPVPEGRMGLIWDGGPGGQGGGRWREGSSV